MPLQDGTYRISTELRDTRLHIGVSPESVSAINEGGIPVVPGAESSEATVELHSLDEDRYHINLMYHGKMALEYGDDESERRINVIASPQNGHIEWVIKRGNEPEKHQICTPQSRLYWNINPETPHASQIVLLPSSSGGAIQEWALQFLDNEGS